MAVKLNKLFTMMSGQRMACPKATAGAAFHFAGTKYFRPMAVFGKFCFLPESRGAALSKFTLLSGKRWLTTRTYASNSPPERDWSHRRAKATLPMNVSRKSLAAQSICRRRREVDFDREDDGE